ncbi:helix-turn-helix domain-containing protein [Nocardioides silvaticus]|nr:helix-turn-helix transcriptional regulator [Nocardioides silvaticus]
MHSSFVRGEGSSGPERRGRSPVPLEMRLDNLRVSVENDESPDHRVAHAATLELLKRADRIGTGQYTEGWELFVDAATDLVGEDRWAIQVAVMANMVGIVDLGDADDFVTAARLIKRYGHRKVALVQGTVDRLLGNGPALPLATRTVQVVADRDRVSGIVRTAGWNEEKAVEVADRCYQMGFWLVLTDVDPNRPGPILRTPEEVARVWDHGGIQAWRGQVAIIASNPWAPYGSELKELALAADRPFPVYALEEAVRVYRSRFERRERELVAREIRRLVAISGLSQREFASMAGTSASRLSTYVNGLVTPSATMMVRIRRVTEYVQNRRPDDKKR